MLVLLAFACTEMPTEAPPPTPFPRVTVSDLIYPDHPWGVASATFTGDPMDFDLVAVDPDGLSVLFDAEVQGNAITWSPREPLQPGVHTVRAALGVDLADFETEVLPYGLDPDFEGLVGGDAFRLTGESARWVHPDGLGPLIDSQLTQDPVFEVLGVEGDQVAYRIAMVERDGSAACSAHMGTATLTEEGLVTWEAPLVEFPMQGTPMAVHDVSFRLPLWGDQVGGGQVQALLDTTPLDPFVAPNNPQDATCELVGIFGIECEECPDGAESCLALNADDIVGEAWEPPWALDGTLAPCVLDAPPPVDFDFDFPPIECGPIGCSTGPSGVGGFFALLGLLAVRRSS